MDDSGIFSPPAYCSVCLDFRGLRVFEFMVSFFFILRVYFKSGNSHSSETRFKKLKTI